MSGPIRRLLRRAARPLAQLAARAYLAGPSLTDAVGLCQALAAQGYAATLAYWNSAGDPPDWVAVQGVATLRALPAIPSDCYLSIKPPALGYSVELLSRLRDESRSFGTRLHLDSLGPETATPAYRLMAALTNGLGVRLGCTLPGRWRRSLEDAERAITQGWFIRVVKGQWPDPHQDLDPRAGFLAIIDRLAGRARHVAVATHDDGLAAEALRRLRAADTPCELELLLGFPTRKVLRAAAQAVVPVRFYVPYGHPCLPYRLVDAIRNPRLLAWLMADLAAHASRPLPTNRGLCATIRL
jgi:proline dehydrogenase